MLVEEEDLFYILTNTIIVLYFLNNADNSFFFELLIFLGKVCRYQGSVWDGFGYILTIILFSLFYNVTKFFEFETKYSLCAEVNISMIFIIESTLYLTKLCFDHLHHHLQAG